jgi:hypothetical protein
MAGKLERDHFDCLRLALISPPPRSPPRWERPSVSGKIVQRYEHGKPGDFSHLTDEELKESLYDVTKELEELDPEFAEFAKQLVKQRATKHETH